MHESAVERVTRVVNILELQCGVPRLSPTTDYFSVVELTYTFFKHLVLNARLLLLRTAHWPMWTALQPLRPCSTSAPPLHNPAQRFAPFPAWRACTPVTSILDSRAAQRSARGVAPRINAAQAAKAPVPLFQETNEK
jgi:hypothetical protein